MATPGYSRQHVVRLVYGLKEWTFSRPLSFESQSVITTDQPRAGGISETGPNFTRAGRWLVYSTGWLPAVCLSLS